MNREVRWLVMGLFVFAAGTVEAAELSIGWNAGGGKTIELAVGEEAIIDVTLAINAGDTLSGVFFTNEAVIGVEQTSQSTALANWVTGTKNAPLGIDSQQFAVAASTPLSDSVDGPGTIIVGSQTVKVTSGSVGDELEIAINVEGLGIGDETGSQYTRTVTGSSNQDDVGVFHIGVGSPGYSSPTLDDERDPLVIKIVAGSSGTDTNGTSTGGTDGDDDGVPDDQDAFPDDPAETTDTDNDGTGDNADTDDDDDGVNDDSDAFPTDPAETIDTDGDGIGNNADTDDDGDGIADDEDTTPTGEDGNGTTAPSGPCGVGVVSFLPLCLLGLLLMHSSRERHLRRD